MGITFVAKALTAAQVEAVLVDRDLLGSLLFPEDDGPGDETDLDLDKAWHGVHYLLTRTRWETPTPLGTAILGGLPIGPDNGYGPARLLYPPEVKAVAAALAEVDHAALQTGFDPTELQRNEIYPAIWEEEDIFDEYLLPSLIELTTFYTTAAENGSAVALLLN